MDAQKHRMFKDPKLTLNTYKLVCVKAAGRHTTTAGWFNSIVEKLPIVKNK